MYVTKVMKHKNTSSEPKIQIKLNISNITKIANLLPPDNHSPK